MSNSDISPAREILMSVLACDRSKCPNIMCDRLILGRRFYICNDCFNELLEYKKTWTPPMTKKEIQEKLETFMHTEPGSYTMKETPEDIDEVFDELTNQ